MKNNLIWRLPNGFEYSQNVFDVTLPVIVYRGYRSLGAKERRWACLVRYKMRRTSIDL